jgi:putative transposase
MARPIRIESSGALYHVTARGNRQEDIYEDDTDRSVFLSVLEKTCSTHNWTYHAYCLMSNHYHLLIEASDSNLSKGKAQESGLPGVTAICRENAVSY